jgi:hypothetical protein
MQERVFLHTLNNLIYKHPELFSNPTLKPIKESEAGDEDLDSLIGFKVGLLITFFIIVCHTSLLHAFLQNKCLSL